MKARNASKIAWLSQIRTKLFSYPNKGLTRKQFISCFALSIFASFSISANSGLPEEEYTVATLAAELHSPWSMVELPDGTWLITERDGHVVIKKDSGQHRVNLKLDGLYLAGQGGLLDIVLSPDYSVSKEIYFTYAQGELKENRLVIAKATFNGSGFSQPETVYRLTTDKATPQHYAGRALVLPDNTLLFSSGDGFDYREQAQVTSSQLGKILRINLDGSIPKDNPFIDHTNPAAHAVFSVGHRNTQGLVYDYDSQQIVSHEHGPAGGDELNYISAGSNYGWPVITHGRDYSGARISPFTEYTGMKQPIVNWTPSIAPSGMAYYGADRHNFSSLQRHVLITTLVNRKLYAINLTNGKFTQTHVFPEVSGRLRDVLVTQQGNIAILTDGDDAKLLLISAN
ncbi:PQQ-dependent sugar dehydrogenase [Thalassotalea mangrovi]|uniref:PQQ-dependent sugar dehydrogenase n=1 Tax=Thalassotalea mangrovi TaxID=2572245 RepID=A0A4U1B4P7_9GAMM|nr:PQQ-dependent sugar dehydrogenase [Thalassotalea mangrovi]TKB44396.1 PQQ-dependent sugar dehydrogenase [Thalassotalea mangrovi]